MIKSTEGKKSSDLSVKPAIRFHIREGRRQSKGTEVAWDWRQEKMRLAEDTLKLSMDLQHVFKEFSVL